MYLVASTLVPISHILEEVHRISGCVITLYLGSDGVAVHCSLTDHMLGLRSEDPVNMCSMNCLQDIWETCYGSTCLLEFIKSLLPLYAFILFTWMFTRARIVKPDILAVLNTIFQWRGWNYMLQKCYITLRIAWLIFHRWHFTFLSLYFYFKRNIKC